MRPAAGSVVDHPANAGLRRYREPRHQRPGMAALTFPEAVVRPYETLGTHPDLVARLWDELGKALPVDCRAVFYGGPALIHPETVDCDDVLFVLDDGVRVAVVHLTYASHPESDAGWPMTRVFADLAGWIGAGMMPDHLEYRGSA